MEQQELNQLIQDYERLFHKVLQRCSLFPGQVDYEDHLQELRLLFFMRAKEYATKSEFKAANDITYLFRHLLWRMGTILSATFAKRPTKMSRITHE